MIKLRVLPLLIGWFVFAAAGLLISTLLAVAGAKVWAVGWTSSEALLAVAVVAFVLGLWVILSRTRRTDRRIDPLAAARAKMKVNAEKYPAERARGSSRKYAQV